MAGWVLVVSLLFSPGMLPADRPSHLYLNLIPLCFGCSMISMKGFAGWIDRQAEVRGEEEMWLDCSVLEIQKHSIWIGVGFLRCFTWISVSTEITLSMFTDPHVYSWPACTQYQYWFIQNTDNLLEAASYLGWVSSGSIHTRLWWTENKNRLWLTDWLKVLEWLVDYHLHYMTHNGSTDDTNQKAAFSTYLWYSKSLSFVVWPGWKSTGWSSVQRGQGTLRYKGFLAKYNNSS